MNHLDVWFDLVDTHRDLEFADALAGWLNHLKQAGTLDGWRLTRRKFGFGPGELGEFHVRISAESLAHLDRAFDLAAARTGETERLHARVYAMVRNVRSGLFRDFPDRVRVAPS